MNEIRISPAAEAEIDDIWLHVARESHSIEIANRVVDGIADRFGLLARMPLRDARAKTWVRMCGASQPMAM